MEKKNTAMVSRSLRLKEDTLSILKGEAEDLDMGITVYIRFLLEKHVADTLNLADWENLILAEEKNLLVEEN